MTTPADELLLSPLHSAHLALGATMAPFGGWQMPISYANSGVVAEHQAVRNSVGIFDVSHLGKASITGLGAAEFVNRCFSNDLTRIGPGQAQYTLCCNNSGGVVDDLIAYYVSDEEVFLVPNAANTAAVVELLSEAAQGSGITVTNQHRDFGVIAVQGPQSAATLAAVGLPTDLEYMAWADSEFQGLPVRVCRTGYTGEHGYELLPAWDVALPLWDSLLAQADAIGGRAAGLGARDTLRTEMGYALHGQDLSADISPVQARSGWAVGWKKEEFFGRDALLAEKEAGPSRLAWGLLVLDRGIPRAHQQVMASDGTVIGEVTSGTHSPTLGQGIALALIDTSAGLGEGDDVLVDVRGRKLVARIVKPPFVTSHVR
ncbi:glycine cleavage system aminomethyltransferase GcvT [Nakamurella antarctica]|uniref:Aminomethyltransferase n=1 Tax=Nakamurella antarctica TaxID=1902245 RepID=A0A3G8ZX70_9ACTN|nr:glycine cleavage system aminomethyltransferase GcvT [Nakamurella antarctica]AZI58271.1 glycine cleavage system aminomethyltransferase GcvT [Nakamurella antarctica]